MENLVGKNCVLHFSLITSPNAIGEIVKETPKTLTVRFTKRTFEEKTSSAFPNKKWSDSDKERFIDCIGFERKFWKETMFEFGSKESFGNWSIFEILN